jgi:hypothetical protein
VARNSHENLQQSRVPKDQNKNKGSLSGKKIAQKSPQKSSIFSNNTAAKMTESNEPTEEEHAMEAEEDEDESYGPIPISKLEVSRTNQWSV